MYRDKCKSTQTLVNKCRGNDVIASVISANQHFTSTFSKQIFKFKRHSCKLSFLFLPRQQGAPGSLLTGEVQYSFTGVDRGKNVLNMMYLAQVLMKTLYYDLFLSPDLNQRSVLEIPKVNKLCSQFEKAPKKKITSAGTQCILSGE